MGRDEQGSAHSDHFVAALDELGSALRATIEHAQSALEHTDRIRRQRVDGLTLGQMLQDESAEVLRQSITVMLQQVLDAGGRLRRLVAYELRDDGLSMETIAQLLGISRQRVSALLRSSPGAPDWWPDDIPRQS